MPSTPAKGVKNTASGSDVWGQVTNQLADDAKGKGKGHRGFLGEFSLSRKPKGDLSVAQTLKLLRERGLEIQEDGSHNIGWYMIDPRTSEHLARSPRCKRAGPLGHRRP